MVSYEEAAKKLKGALLKKEPEDIFNYAVEALTLAEKEGKLSKLMEDFPNLYEVVITFDRFFQSTNSL